MKVNSNKTDVLLKEHSEHSKSAQHHDNLLWTVTSIIFSGMIILIGLLVDNLHNTNKLLLTYISVFGIILSIGLYYFAKDFRRIKKFHYDRCKDIGEKIRADSKDNNVLKAPEGGGQWCFFKFILIMIGIGWFLLILEIWKVLP